MSDGMTDIRRDERRADAMNDWLRAVVDWLEGGKSNALRAKIDAAADAVQAIPRGYWTSSQGFRLHSDRVCKGLAADDPEEWRKFRDATDEAPADIWKRIVDCAPLMNKQGGRPT